MILIKIIFFLSTVNLQNVKFILGKEKKSIYILLYINVIITLKIMLFMKQS